jgi:hypothetical protein
MLWHLSIRHRHPFRRRHRWSPKNPRNQRLQSGSIFSVNDALDMAIDGGFTH